MDTTKKIDGTGINARINVRAQMRAAIFARDEKSYGGPGNATQRGKYYAANVGQFINRLIYAI